jgi:glycosyltransferase involved in cell wall biosynthesis
LRAVHLEKLGIRLLNNIDLTIAIPTFNGSRWIGAAMDSVLNQLNDDSRRKVEIVVSDNASTDQTVSIIREYANQYPDTIAYFQQAENIGVDRNIDALFHLAKGTYVWILGDDDLIEDYAIEKLLDKFKSKPASLFLCAPQFLNIDTGETHAPNLFVTDIETRGGDDFFQKTMWASSALSTLCVRRDDWLKAATPEYYNTLWSQMACLIKILAAGGKAYVFAETMVTIRVANPRWARNGSALILGLRILDVLKSMLKYNYAYRTYKIFLDDRFRTNLSDLLMYHPTAIRDKILVSVQMAKHFYNRPSFWFVHLPFIFLPKSLDIRVVAVIQKIKRLLKPTSKSR